MNWNLPRLCADCKTLSPGLTSIRRGRVWVCHPCYTDANETYDLSCIVDGDADVLDAFAYVTLHHGTTR
jgi:hypothetical protein